MEDQERPKSEQMAKENSLATPTGEEYVSDSELDELLDGEKSLNKAHHV